MHKDSKAAWGKNKYCYLYSDKNYRTQSFHKPLMVEQSDRTCMVHWRAKGGRHQEPKVRQG